MRREKLPSSRANRSLLRIPSMSCLICMLLILASWQWHTLARAGMLRAAVSNLYVLSIGIDKYPMAPSGFSIRYAVADAEGVATAFSTENTRNIFNKVEVKILLDDSATLAGVRSAFEHLISVCKPEDVIVFYFAGQGRPAPPQETGALQSGFEYNFAVSDTVVNGNDLPTQNEFSARELSLLLLSSQAQRQIVILDSAFSSVAFKSLQTALNSDSVFTLGQTGRRFALLGIEGASIENAKLGHGVMTSALLEAMTGEADIQHKGFITEADLEGYVMSHLNYMALQTRDPAAWQFGEQLLSYSDLRGLCLSAVTDTKCDASYGYNPIVEAPTKTRGLKPDQPSTAEQVSTRGTDYALIFAGDTYDHWPRLNNPILDAQTLQRELVQNYGYAKTNILYRENPTETDILASLEYLKKRSYGKNDRLLVYVAGHGLIDNSGEGFLVTRESLLPAEDPYLKTPLDLSRFRDSVNLLPINHILVVLDVCHGGYFKDRRLIPEYTAQNLDSPPSMDALVADKMKSMSRLYIASGGLRETSDGVPGMHSPFARTFLKTLRLYGGQEHLIDVGKLDGAIYGVCPQPYYGTFGSQQEGGDFIFLPDPQAHPVPDTTLEAKVEGQPCAH